MKTAEQCTNEELSALAQSTRGELSRLYQDKCNERLVEATKSLTKKKGWGMKQPTKVELKDRIAELEETVQCSDRNTMKLYDLMDKKETQAKRYKAAAYALLAYALALTI